MAQLICDARRQHPSWGPEKLVAWLAPRHPALALPAISPAGDLLARRGLVQTRRRRRHSQHPGVVPIATTQPNDLWTADFKDHFRTRDGVYGYPLTVADQHTRSLLACHGLPSTTGHGVRPVFDRLFRECGLPRAIRTDTGVPFATTGLHGLSPPTVWWLRPGIQHQRIHPASPQETGAHEERPHECLEGATPASRDQPSARPSSGALPPIEYPGHFLVKRMTSAGTFRFTHRLLVLSHALDQHPIGLEEVDDGIWSMHVCQVLLGRLDERDDVIRP